MSRQNVNLDFKFGDSDAFMLTDIDTNKSLMLIPCDTAGNFSWTGVTRAPLERNAMQTSNTSNQYSDLQRPWISIPQEDWGGGRGNEIFTKDTTRYSDGKRAQAAFQECIFNGPLDYYSNGSINRAISTNCPQSLHWEKVLESKKYVGVKFLNISAITSGEIYIHIRRRGTPSAPLIAELVTALNANTALYRHQFTTTEINDTLAEFKKFTFTNVSLSANTNYYIRVRTNSGDSENYWEIGCGATNNNNTYISRNGTSFTSASFEMLYRVANAQTDQRCKFFEYEQLQFAVRQQGENGTPSLLMNGEIGKATSWTGTTLTDSSKSWATNQWKGAQIGLVYQVGAQSHVDCWRTIAGNSATQITVEDGWTINPNSDTAFIINDTPIWQTITGHGLTAHVTDVHVINGIVYFAQGDYANVRKMRWNNGSFEFKSLSVFATFLQSVRDSQCMMLYRARNDGINNKRTVERSVLLDWMSSETSWTTVTDAITTKTREDRTETKSVTTVEKSPTPKVVTTSQIHTEVTDTAHPDDATVTLNSTVTTTLGGQTSKTVGTTRTQGTTATTSGTQKTVTTTVSDTETTEEKDIADPTSQTVNTSTSRTIDGVTYTDTDSVSNSKSISVSISGNEKTTTTTESTTNTTHTVQDPPLRTSIVTESKDFTTCDYDSLQYVITISDFVSDNYTGACTITLQESEDNSAFTDVQTVTAKSEGVWRIFAHCQYRYRRFQITATGANCTINNIAITTSQTPHFEDPFILQDNYGKITRLFEYGAEMTKNLWIAQEGMLSSINKVEGTTDTYTLDRINMDELQTTSEMWNATSMTTADVYLVWGWLNGLQRYYNTQLEGKGPDHDEGLPFDRQGRITQIISYPSNFFISVDAGDGYSSVMQFNQSGWHEIYRAPNAGERIHDLAFQPIYGERPDRLWMSVGDDIVWLTMPSKVIFALHDQHAEYTHESVIVSAWHTAGMMDIEKLWQTLKIMADYLDGTTCWIEADYQVDGEEVWHPVASFYTGSPSDKHDLNDNGSVNGKRFRYRLRLQTTDMYKTPKVNAVVLEAVGRVDIKMSYNFYFRNIKYKRDLNAEFEDIEPLDVQEVLDEWANTLKKLRLNSRWKIFDDKLVYLDAVQTSVLNELSEGYIGQITLNEL